MTLMSNLAPEVYRTLLNFNDIMSFNDENDNEPNQLLFFESTPNTSLEVLSQRGSISEIKKRQQSSKDDSSMNSEIRLLGLAALQESRSRTSSSASPSGGLIDRQVLQNYMSNQMDLNESETLYYEEQINELLEQIEVLRNEKINLENDSSTKIFHLEQELEELKQFKILHQQRELEELEQCIQIEKENGRGETGDGESTAQDIEVRSTSSSPIDKDKGISNGEAEINALRQRLENTLDLHKEESNNYERIIEELIEKVEQSEEESIRLRDIIHSKDEELILADESLKLIQSRVEKTMLEQQQRSSSSPKLSDEITRLQMALDEKEAEIQRLENILQESKSSAVEQKRQKKELMKMVDDLNQKLRLAAAELSTISQRESELRQSNNTLQQEFDVLSSDYSSTLSSFNELQTELQKSNQLVTESKSDLDFFKTKYDAKIAEIDKFKADLKRANIEIEKHVTQNAELHRRIEDMNKYQQKQQSQNDWEQRYLELNASYEELTQRQLQDQLLGITGDALLEMRDENARLREEIDLMTENNIKLSDLVDEKQKLLTLEQDTTSRLKILLADVGEKADQLESNHEKVRQDLIYQLEEMTEREQAYIKECEDLREQLRAGAMQLDSLHSDVNMHSERLADRLNSLIDEKARLERSLKQQQEKAKEAEKLLALKSDELQKMSTSIRDLADMTDHYNRLAMNQEAVLNKQVQFWFDNFEGRVKNISGIVHLVMNYIPKQAALSDSDLVKAKMSLEEAESKYSDSQAEVSSLLTQLENAKKTIEELDQGLKGTYEAWTSEVQVNSELQKRIEELELKTERHLSNDKEEVKKQLLHVSLEQRLLAVENDAKEIFKSEAKTRATSVRTIETLEGDCARMKSLIDHLRTVNAKLTGDVKVANEMGARVRSLEYQLDLSKQTEATLLERIRNSEISSHKRELEMMQSLKRIQNEDEEKENKLRQSVLGAPASQSAHRSETTYNENGSSSDSLPSLQTSTCDIRLLKTAQEALASSEARLQATQDLLRTNEVKLSAQSILVAEQEGEIKSLESQLVALKMDIARSTDLHLQKIREWEEERYEKKEALLSSEAALNLLKSKHHDLEVAFGSKEEALASALSKQMEYVEEDRQLRLQLEVARNETASLKETNEILMARLDEAQAQAMRTTSDFDSFKSNEYNEMLKLYDENKFELSEVISAKQALEVDLELALKEKQTLLDIQKMNEQRMEHMSRDIETLNSENRQLNAENGLLSEQTIEAKNKMSNMLETLREREEEIRIANSNAIELEGKSAAQNVQISTLQSNLKEITGALKALETFMTKKMRDSVISATNITPVKLRKSGGAPSASDLFASPPPSNLVSEIQDMMTEMDGGSTASNDVSLYDVEAPKGLVNKVKAHYEALQERAEELARRHEDMSNVVERCQKDVTDALKRRDTAEQSLVMANNEKDSLSKSLKQVLQDLSAAQDASKSLTYSVTVTNEMLDQFFSSSQSLFLQLDQSVHEVSSRLSILSSGSIHSPTTADDMYYTLKQDTMPTFKHDLQTKFQLSKVENNVFPQVHSHHMHTSSVLERVGFELRKRVEKVVMALSFITSGLESTMDNATKKIVALENVVGSASEREQEVAQLKEKIEKLKNEKNHASQLVGQVNVLTKERDSISNALSESVQKFEAMEEEFRDTAITLDELKIALQESERVCEKLSRQNVELTRNIGAKEEEMTILISSSESLKSKNVDIELRLEELKSELERVKNERDSIDASRRALEDTVPLLDNSYASPDPFQQHQHNSNNSKTQQQKLDESYNEYHPERAFFENEKLCMALTLALEQLSHTLSPILPHAPYSLTHPLLQQQNQQSLSARSETLMNRLREVGDWVKTCVSTNRKLTHRVDDLEQELARVTSLAQSLSHTLNEQKKTLMSHDDLSRNREKDLIMKSNNQESVRVSEEVARLKSELEEANRRVQESEKIKAEIILDVRMKERQIIAEESANAEHISTIQRLEQRIEQLMKRAVDAESETKRIEEELRVSRLHSSALSQSVDTLTQSLALKEKEREESDKRHIEDQREISNLKSNIARLKSVTMSPTRDVGTPLQTAVAARSALEIEHGRDMREGLHRELASVKRLLAAAERESLAQKDRADAAVATHLFLNQSLHELKEKLDHELRQKRTAATIHSQESVVSSLNQKIDSLEKELRSLSQSNLACKREKEEISKLLHVERERRERADASSAKLQSLLDVANKNLATQASHSQSMRIEARDVKDTVAKCDQKVNLCIHNLSAFIFGEASPKPRTHHSASGLGFIDMEHESQAKMSHALGINELVFAIDKLEQISSQCHELAVTSQGKIKAHEEEIAELKGEKARLEIKILDVQNACEERIQRLRKSYEDTFMQESQDLWQQQQQQQQKLMLEGKMKLDRLQSVLANTQSQLKDKVNKTNPYLNIGPPSPPKLAVAYDNFVPPPKPIEPESTSSSNNEAFSNGGGSLRVRKEGERPRKFPLSKT